MSGIPPISIRLRSPAAPPYARNRERRERVSGGDFQGSDPAFPGTANAESRVPPLHHPLHRSYASNPTLWTRHHLRFQPDPIQSDLLAAADPYILLNCTRQWGKTTVIAAKALHFALFHPRTTTLVAAPSERQSFILLRRLQSFLQTLGIKPAPVPNIPLSLRLPNASEIIALPASADTIRGFTAHLLIFDEAARVPDSLYHALSPARATTAGPLWLLSTPNGPTGFFYDAWHDDNSTPIRGADPRSAVSTTRVETSPFPASRDCKEPASPLDNRERRERIWAGDCPQCPQPVPPLSQRSAGVDTGGLSPSTSTHLPTSQCGPEQGSGLERGPAKPPIQAPDADSPSNRERRERVPGDVLPSEVRERRERVLDDPSAPPSPRWRRFLVPATACPRISSEFLDLERINLGDTMFRQEYLCEFIAGPHALFSLELLESAIDYDHQPLFTEPLFSNPGWNRS